MTKPVGGANMHAALDVAALLVERAGAIDAAAALKIQDSLVKLTASGMFSKAKNGEKEFLNELLTNVSRIKYSKEKVLKFDALGIKILLQTAKLSEADTAKFTKLWAGQPLTPDVKEDGKKVEARKEESEEAFYSRWSTVEQNYAEETT